jgi:NitT/TauT family transport system substrate-binding protein
LSFEEEVFMRRQFLNRALQASLATLVLAATGAAHAQAPTKLNFRLDWTVYGTHAPFYLALDKGLYAKEGLDVKIEEGQGSGTVAKLVAQGNDHMGFIDFTSMTRGVEQGMPLVAVMRVVSNNMAIVSHADAPIASPKDLEGKVIAYAPSESTAQMFPALALSQKVEMGKINVINPAFGAKNALFLQKRADAFTASTNVQVAQVEAQGAKTAYFRYSDFGVSLMNNGIVANKDFVAKNPEALKKFLRVTRDAFQMATANPEEAIDAMVRQRPQDARNRAVLLRQLQLSPELYTTERTKGQPFGFMDRADWADNQDLLVKYGGLPKAVPVETLFTNDFLPK